MTLSFLIAYVKFHLCILTREFFREIAMFSSKLSSFNNLFSAIMNDFSYLRRQKKKNKKPVNYQYGASLLGFDSGATSNCD